ncbi:MAG: hypothetical protein NVS4B7_16200 [Ktedonobacteraceae bacterium]
MNSTSRLHSYSTNMQTEATATTPVAFQIAISEKEEHEGVSPQQLYQQSMETIWEHVHQLSVGQNKVVLSQLWELGKTTAHPTPNEFPALATHGFITEKLVEGYCVWNPSTPYLKDFWRIGISVSSAHGYMLQAQHIFQANLQASICTIFN